MTLENWQVRRIENFQTKEWLLYKHYAHTLPNVMYSFGMFDDKDDLQGVCCYGTPANNHNNEMGQFKQIELVRLCVNDGLPKNTLSQFVSQTFKLLEGPLSIISYADAGKNHHGYIYQATNWIYTGLGGGVDFYVDENNREIHSRIMSDYRLKWPDKSRKQIAEELHWKSVEGTYKHRYFYFIGDKRNKKIWLKTLTEKYKPKNYPKGDNERYDSSYKPKQQKTLI